MENIFTSKKKTKRNFKLFLSGLICVSLSACTANQQTAQMAESCELSVLGPAALESLVENDADISALYSTCRADFVEITGDVRPSPDEDTIKAVFATLTAYGSRAYGGSVALTPKDLYASQALDCDNYNMLAGHIYKALGGQKPWRFVGFHGGALGNHSVGVLEGGTGLILDPTIGVIGQGTFDDLAGGEPIKNVRSYYYRDDITDYHDRVVEALKTGATEPSDILYWFPDTLSYTRNAASSAWTITPGAYQLAKDLEDGE